MAGMKLVTLIKRGISVGITVNIHGCAWGKECLVVREGHPRVCGDGFLECGGWKKPALDKHAWGLGMHYCLEGGTLPSLLCKYLNLDEPVVLERARDLELHSSS